jgi:hypothetical protein
MHQQEHPPKQWRRRCQTASQNGSERGRERERDREIESERERDRERERQEERYRGREKERERARNRERERDREREREALDTYVLAAEREKRQWSVEKKRALFWSSSESDRTRESRVARCGKHKRFIYLTQRSLLII